MNLSDYKKQFLLLVQTHLSIEINIETLIEVPKRPELGDYALPCFHLSAKLGKNPAEIAAELAKSLKSPHFSKFQNIGPYLNAFVDREKFMETLFSEGNSRSESSGKKVLVEYMNANPNKPLHIGQARNVCIGDSIIRIRREGGDIVHAVNYGDDSGVNVGYNIVGHLYYGYSIDTDKKFDHYCGDIYTEMRSKDEDPEFKNTLSKTLKAIEEGSDENIKRLLKDYTRKCTIAQFESCWRMNAHFNLINWETDILHLNLFEEAIEKLKKQGVITYVTEGEAQGCWVIDLSGVKEFENIEKQYQVLIKSDGVATYVGKDIAYAMWKLGLLEKSFGFEKFCDQVEGGIVYSTSGNYNSDEGQESLRKEFSHYDQAISVIDNRQSFPQSVVSAALGIIDKNPGGKKYQHLAYGVVYITPATLEDFWFELDDEEKAQSRLPFSSRKWWFITIDETLDVMGKKAYEETKRRNPEASEEWLRNVAEKVAVGSFRYFLTKFDTAKDIVFDINAVLDMEWETGAYVMYSYARLKSVLSKNDAPIAQTDDWKLEEDDHFLIKKASEYYQAVDDSYRFMSPNTLAKYLFELSQAFNSYYGKVNILKSEPKMRSMRMRILSEVGEIMKKGCGLMGMSLVEKM